MPLKDFFTYQAEGCPAPMMGYSVQERSETTPVLLPGYKANQVLIMEMIDANQLLRDQVMYYRDELVFQADDHRKSHLAEAAQWRVTFNEMADEISALKCKLSKRRSRAKKKAARKK